MGIQSKTKIKRGATLGANSTIICGNEVGEFAFVGAGALVSKKCKKFGLYVGTPAVQIGWVNVLGQKLNLPLLGNNHIYCDKSKLSYSLKDSNLEIIND